MPQNNETERNHRFLEVVPKDSVFATRIFFENTTPGEMGLLIRAIGVDFPDEGSDTPRYRVPVKIGGAKPRCLGAVRFVVKGIRHLPNSREDFFSALAEGGKSASIIKTVQEWLRDESLIDEESWLRFREYAKPMDEPCPKELY